MASNSPVSAFHISCDIAFSTIVGRKTFSRLVKINFLVHSDSASQSSWRIDYAFESLLLFGCDFAAGLRGLFVNEKSSTDRRFTGQIAFPITYFQSCFDFRSDSKIVFQIRQFSFSQSFSLLYLSPKLIAIFEQSFLFNLIFTLKNKTDMGQIAPMFHNCYRLREWNLLQNLNEDGFDYVIWPQPPRTDL